MNTNQIDPFLHLFCQFVTSTSNWEVNSMILIDLVFFKSEMMHIDKSSLNRSNEQSTRLEEEEEEGREKATIRHGEESEREQPRNLIMTNKKKIMFIWFFSSILFDSDFFSFNFRLWQRHGLQSLIFIALLHLRMDGKLKVVTTRILTITPPHQWTTRKNRFHHNHQASFD